MPCPVGRISRLSGAATDWELLGKVSPRIMVATDWKLLRERFPTNYAVPSGEDLRAVGGGNEFLKDSNPDDPIWQSRKLD